MQTIGQVQTKKEALSGAFFWLSAFYFVYSGRPQDWIPGLEFIPLAKITAIAAMLSLLLSWGKTPRRFRDLPKEASYLLAMVVLLFASAAASPIWKGGALSHTVDFAKVYVAWALTFFLVTTLSRLQRIIVIQTISVVLISAAAIVKGHSAPRLSGVIGGIYSNPNDLAFAIVLCLPFCLALLLNSKSTMRKMAWCCGMLVMAAALFLTASRAGFIDLVISGTVCLWYFGVKGKRLYLIVAATLVGAVLLVAFGGTLRKRFAAISGDELNSQVEGSAYDSYEERKLVMERAIEGIAHYPILGLGRDNFPEYSGVWKEVHVSYLQIGVEGGVAVLVLYLLFFARGFSNLKYLRRLQLDPEATLFVGALHSSLIGFVVGACFAPEAYQFFPYFTVCYTSVLAAMARERATAPVKKRSSQPRRRFAEAYVNPGGSSALTPAG